MGWVAVRFREDTDVEMLGFRADGQERILETLVQKGSFIIAKGQDPRA